MKLIKGLAGSPGKITGKARVIKSLDDVDKFKPGDILVTIATDPTWTPVMHMASAIVTDLVKFTAHKLVISFLENSSTFFLRSDLSLNSYGELPNFTSSLNLHL